VDAVVGEFLGSDVLAKFAGVPDLCEQVLDQVVDMLLCFIHVLSVMRDRLDPSRLPPSPVADERVGSERSLEPYAGVPGLHVAR
jgi:hypothetical protein